MTQLDMRKIRAEETARKYLREHHLFTYMKNRIGLMQRADEDDYQVQELAKVVLLMADKDNKITSLELQIRSLSRIIAEMRNSR